ncbi:6-O-methylguanine DNA methyltransferase [Lipomyces japonicus]|uniref:6-O-methylguanine DNA methyltransferase n=1 Tax=Lipomyces japonicus TaxID=56871 RepID=UPI0034CD80CF
MTSELKYAISKETPIGYLLLSRGPNGINYLSIGSDPDKLKILFRKENPNKIFQQSAEINQVLDKIICRYITDGSPKNESDADFVNHIGPLDFSDASPLQAQVWNHLIFISRGQTESYGQVAVAIGKSKGHSRAVGTACGKNRIALLIPCHRVRASSGQLTGFKWDTWRKLKLLEYEGAIKVGEKKVQVNGSAERWRFASSSKHKKN